MLLGMSGTGLRERKKERTRQALAGSALRQFAERGFDHVTVEEIADDCDISPRTFFRYFASKEDVLFADSDARQGRLLDSLAAQPADFSALQTLQAAVLDVATEYELHRDEMVARRDLISSTPSLQARAIERYQGWEGELIGGLRRAGRVEGMSDLELRLTVAAATTALRVAVELWIDDPTAGDLSDVLTSALDHLRSGLDA